MKFTTVSIKEIQADKTHRLDAGYWIKKKQKKNKPSSSQAGGPSHKESGLKRLKKVAKIYEDQKTLEEHFKKV